MTPQLIGTIGLTFNILGVMVAFFFGYPQPSHEEGDGRRLAEGTLMPDGRSAGDYAANTRRRRKLFLILSRCGLGLMLAGFAIQLWAVWTVAPNLVGFVRADPPAVHPDQRQLLGCLLG